MDGCTIRVSTTGAGRPLLLLPGIGSSIELWRPLREHLGDRSTIAFDPPGIGASPGDRRLWTIGRTARLASAVLARWAPATGPDPDVLGYSLGGLVAQHLARIRPVRRLVLVATTAGQPAIPPLPHRLLAMLQGGLAFQGGGRRISGDHAQDLGHLMGGQVTRDPAALAAALIHLTTSPPSAAGYYGQALAASTWTGLHRLRQLTMPSLVVAGDDDRLVPPANSRLLACLLPQSRLRVLAGAGHLLVLDDAARVGAEVRPFLDA